MKQSCETAHREVPEGREGFSEKAAFTLRSEGRRAGQVKSIPSGSTNGHLQSSPGDVKHSIGNSVNNVVMTM